MGLQSRRALIVNSLTVALFAAMGARNLLIPLYADSLGATRIQVGLLFSSYFVSAACMAIPAALISNRLGQRGVIVGALLAADCAQLISGLSNQIWVLFGCQILGGLSFGTLQTQLLNALAQAVPARRMGTAIGLQTLTGQLGQVGGSAAAGIALARFGLGLDLIVFSVPLTVALALAAFGFESRKSIAGPVFSTAGFVRGLLAVPRLPALAILTFGGTLVLGTSSAYLPLFGEHGLGLSGLEIGYLLAIQTAANAATRIPAGYFIDKVSEPTLRWLPAVGVGMYSIGLALLPHAKTFFVVASLLLLITPFIATAFVALPSVFVRVPLESRVIALGLYTLLISAGNGLGPTAFGPFMERGFVEGFTATALVGVAMCGAALALRRTTSSV